MEIFRITKARYASHLIASGNAGRWNYKGEKVIYCAASRALASLEVLLHTSGEILADHSFKISVIALPAHVAIEKIDQKHLPSRWNGLSPYLHTQSLGSRWIKSCRSVILKVPSSIIIQEFNYIINPNHPDFKKIRLVDIEDHICDPRLMEKMKG